jgi:hypothetical protein
MKPFALPFAFAFAFPFASAFAERLPEIALKDASGQAVKLPGDRPTVLVLGSFS